METLNFLLYPFLASLVLILIHTYFGIHILERGIIFVDIALAQFIGIGIALSFFLSIENTYIASIIFATFGAFVLSMSKKIAEFINIEAFIGVLYIFSFAISILILDISPRGLEEFKAILNGNILWVTQRDVLDTFVLYAIVGIINFIFRERFLELSYKGRDNFFWEFLFFFGFAIVLVKSVQMAGILQVFSFLIVPALIGRLWTEEPWKVLLIGWIVGLLACILSIGLSYKLDLPTAPVTVAVLGMIFFLLLSLKAIRKKS